MVERKGVALLFFLAASETTTLGSPTPQQSNRNGAPGRTRTDEYEFTKLAL